MRYFASIGTDLVCNSVQSSEGDVIASNVFEVTAQVEAGTPLDDFAHRKYVNGVWSAEKYTVPAANPLDLAKQLKLVYLTTACHAALETFTSSALTTPHTYLSRANSIPNDMLLLTAEYAFVKGDDYDLQPITWYTVEGGNVQHTKAQIVQVYLDARKNVATQMYHRAALEADVNAATTIDAVNAIVW